MKIAIIGSQGLPAKYGGFETLVEYLAEYLSSEFEITVFCSSKIYPNKFDSYKGCKLQYVTFNANGIQSIPYDIFSLIKSVKNFDKILILGASGGLVMPLLSKYRKKFILNFGGLDWNRSKWGFFAQKVLKLSESFAIKNSEILIADNEGIQNYIQRTYNRKSNLIEYGGDQALNVQLKIKDLEKYPFLNGSYAFSVARIQPDNNIEMILEAFSNNPKIPIIFVGNWTSSAYGRTIRVKYSICEKIILLDAIYNQRELDLLRSNCTIYIHGHSAGGTNPSLVEAMNLGLPIIAYTSGFNEFTTKHQALYFSSTNELFHVIQCIASHDLVSIGNNMRLIADTHYKWALITKKYAKLFQI